LWILLQQEMVEEVGGGDSQNLINSCKPQVGSSTTYWQSAFLAFPVTQLTMAKHGMHKLVGISINKTTFYSLCINNKV